MIKINKAFGNVAGWIPLFNIGGTMSKVKVKYNRIEEITIITADTINELLKKRDKLLFVPFSLCTSFI